MEANVTHFTLHEGGEWHGWPFRESVKPSNPQLLTWPGGRRHMLWVSRPHGVAIRFHSIKLSDGSEWDATNGFRKPEWNGPH